MPLRSVDLNENDKGNASATQTSHKLSHHHLLKNSMRTIRQAGALGEPFHACNGLGQGPHMTGHMTAHDRGGATHMPAHASVGDGASRTCHHRMLVVPSADRAWTHMPAQWRTWPHMTAHATAACNGRGRAAHDRTHDRT